MDISYEFIVSKLNALIETCRDGEQGYRAAARDVRNEDLKSMCSGLAVQRHQFVQELEQIVRSQREAPEKSGSVVGALHRGWIHLRSAVTSGDETAILSECERGEEAAVAQYREALELPGLSEELLGILRLQFMGVQGAYQHVREVREHFQQQDDAPLSSTR